MNKSSAWTLAILINIVLFGYLAYAMLNDDTQQARAAKAAYLPGKSTNGHYQIEMACSACHDTFTGVKQDACIECHGEALKAAADSHPKRKFTDPRNWEKRAILDAAVCVACHREHDPDIIHPMDVSLPDDLCFNCHDDIGQERPSHKDLAFDTCASSGCHNYHDNTALYENFLIQHLHEPDTLENPIVKVRKLPDSMPKNGEYIMPLTVKEADAPVQVAIEDPTLLHEWETTMHAHAKVNCNDCHLVEDKDTGVIAWKETLDHEACVGCHADEVEGFMAGRHGMRLVHGLSPMTPAMARLPMKEEAYDKTLGCNSCHTAHTFDSQQAAVDACLGCHDDQHSRDYKQSPHFELWQAEQAGTGEPGSGISCATCHMPRIAGRRMGKVHVAVEHNQNFNLRPNEQMIRSVCMHCHGLGFSIDALADAALLKNNFNGEPSRHIESLDLAEDRERILEAQRGLPEGGQAEETPEG